MTYFIAAVIVIAFAMIIGISQRKHPELEGDSYQFSFNAENYVYQGGKLTDQQMHIAIDILQNQYDVGEIHLGHRKTNTTAAKLYEQLGFQIVGEDEQDYFRVKVL
ncbi:MAG: hypothetical protein J6C00_12735 [Eubacterium sp.]|nr:hypothetical protein [Eubacterium sp.]